MRKVGSYVRNPIFSAMVSTSAGLALLVPNAIALAAWVALLLAIEIQVGQVRGLLEIRGDAARDFFSRDFVTAGA